nr:MAG TPA: hypothetical protein [Caudoviricetes sp.]
METKVNKQYVLKDLDGNYNMEVHKKLNNIIHNIASNLIRTNPYLSIEDIEQEAWCRVIEVINKNLENGRELEISYLVRTAQSSALGYCIRQSKKTENYDDFAISILNSYDRRDDDSLNITKAKLEYELSLSRPDEYKLSLLRMALEELISKIDDIPVRNLIVIKYVKEFNGTSPVITKYFNDFYNSIDDDRKFILDNMDKFTNNAAFRALNMRATDNESTRIRKKMRELIETLREYL